MADDFSSIVITPAGLAVTTDDNDTYLLDQDKVNDIIEDVDDVSGDAFSKALERQAEQATGSDDLDVDDPSVGLTSFNLIVPTSEGDVWLSPFQVSGLSDQLHDTLKGSEEHYFVDRVEDKGEKVSGPVVAGYPIESLFSLSLIPDALQGLYHTVTQALPFGAAAGSNATAGAGAIASAQLLSPVQGLVDSMAGLASASESAGLAASQLSQQSLETQMLAAAS